MKEFKLAQHVNDSVWHSVNQRVALAAKAAEQSLRRGLALVWHRRITHCVRTRHCQF